jgi:3-oxoacyl-[acyl-carrier protein] reductase
MKTALITGSTKGIGKQIGIDLLNKGYFVYFNGHTQESAKQLEQELNDLNYANNSNIICTDLSLLEKNLELTNYLKAQDIYLDVLVLNLGITDRTPFGAICYDSWKKVMDTNLNFPFFLIQSLASHIRENGRIVFISSVLSEVPHGTSISYAVSKAGINALAKNLAKYFSENGITVNVISPGFIRDTDWHKDKSNTQIKRIEDKILLKRFGITKEISSLVMEIINNQYINGTILRVDGGYDLK